jgi:hypothetical protein
MLWPGPGMGSFLPEGRGGEDTAKGAGDGFKLTTLNARMKK